MKKVLSIVLSLVMVLCMMPAMAFAGTDATYTDIAGETCESAVTTLSGLGVVDGYPDGSYKPEVTVKRAEAAKLIIAALGLEKEAAGTKASFTDLAGYEWAEGYIGYAESLGILKGDGNGLYRPADTVSYNEMAAIVIRALGYTDEALQGTFPAAHVAKAKALGAFKDVTSGGSAGADRGDCAIMIYNVLAQRIGTVDKDGYWSANVNNDSMIVRLGAAANKVDGNGKHVAEVVTLAQAKEAKVDLYPYIGASAYLYKNADSKIVAIGEVESTFLTGKFTSATAFEVDGVKYKVTDETLPKLTKNYDVTNTAYSTATEYTIAAKVTGKTISEVYSILTWDGTTFKMTKTDVATLAKNDTLKGQTFEKNTNQEIDTTKFELLGVDSLADIKADDIVTYYLADGNVIKVEVTDETVTGKITKIDGDKYTVNGVEYDELNDVMAGKKAGDEVKLILDYAGDIFAVEAITNTSEYAIVLNAQAGTPAAAGTIDAKDAKIVLYTAEGETSYVVDTTKVTTYNNTGVAAGLVGKLVKFEVSGGKVVAVSAVATGTYNVSSSTKVTKAGYIGSTEISKDVVVFATDKTIAKADSKLTVTDGDKLVKAEAISVLTKADVIDVDINGSVYAVDATTGLVTVMIVPKTSTSDDSVHGVVTKMYKIEKDNEEVNVIDIQTGTEVITGVEYSGMTPTVGGFVNVTTKTDGSVVLAGPSKLDGVEVLLATDDYITVKNTNGTDKLVHFDKSADADVVKGELASDVTVIVKAADGKITLGTTSDLEFNTADKKALVYTCTDTESAANGLITYVLLGW